MKTGNVMLDRFNEVFDGDGGDYTFTMSHVALSGVGVEVQLDRGEWVLTQRNDGMEWTARHHDRVAATLLLIAARMGMVGELRQVDEPDHD
jgi:hypothetical protein